MKVVNCYTDGSAVVKGVNKGKGGFGTYFPNFYGKPLGLRCGYRETKTGRMELMALLYAIKVFHLNRKESIHLRVYSDSQYVVKSFTEKRLEKWIQAGWKNSSGDVKNIDLWKAIIEELNLRPFIKLEMIWIRGHQLDKAKGEDREKLKKNQHIIGNAMADVLADYKRHEELKPTDKL